MPRDDADFAAYLAARWPALFRSLVLLGCSRAEADEVARTVLARCYTDWERIRHEEDVDVHLYDEVLTEWHRLRRRRTPPATDADGWPEAAVLRVVAELEPEQVDDVLGLHARPVMGATGQELHDAAAEIDVTTPSVAEVVARAHARTRRRLRLGAVGVAAAALVVGGATWVGTRATQPDLPPAKVVRSGNPVDATWYAGGRIHLAGVALTVPGVTALSSVNGGAVYTARDGTVAFVAANGERRRLGEHDPATPLVASAGDGWAAWVERERAGERTLVVYDVSNGAELATRQVGADTLPVAIDQQHVYYLTGDAAYAWQPGPNSPTELPQPRLADVDAATRVYDTGQGAAAQIEMVQPFFSVSFLRPGVGAQLAPGGTVVLTRPPGTDAGAPFVPRLYDVRSGHTLPSNLASGELAVDATFGDNGTIVYLVRPRGADPAGGLLVLRSCDIGAAACYDAVPLRSGQGAVLLAH